MSGDNVPKAVVSVSEMARMVGLSRARFYQLVRAGSFPQPDREPATGRPCYFEEGQRRCLEVRRRNVGIDGKPVLFYARRRDSKAQPSKPPKPKLEAQPEHGVLEHVVGLLPAAHVRVAVKHLPGEPQEPVAGVVKQVVMRSSIPIQPTVDQVLQLGVGANCRRRRHGGFPGMAKSLSSLFYQERRATSPPPSALTSLATAAPGMGQKKSCKIRGPLRPPLSQGRERAFTNTLALLPGRKRHMRRVTVTAVLLTLLALFVGCGPKDKEAAPSPESKAAAGGITQPKSDGKNKAPTQDSKAKGATITQAPPTDEATKPKQPKTDGKAEALRPKQITLTPELKAVFTHVTQYGGRFFADGTKPEAPIVAVRAFGFGKDMKKLKELTSLEHLDLREKLMPQRDPNFDASALKQFKNLKTLALDQASPQDLSHLADIESLETISFEVDVSGKRAKGVTLNDVVQASLAEVVKVKHLKHLRIGNGGVSFASRPSDYTAIPSCPELQYLETWLICDDAALAHIGKSQTLKKLVIVFPKKATFSPKGLSALAAAPNLSSVQLNNADDALCEAIAELPTLKELIVGGSVTKSAIGRIAAKHPDLRIIRYREAFKPPFSEPRDNWMQVLPPNKWRQVMFSKKTGAFLLGPIETNNTENYFDGSL